MITFIVVLAVICALCFVGFTITGALLTTLFWVFVKLPLILIFGILGVAFCCTIILIPLGLGCFRLCGGLVS